MNNELTKTNPIKPNYKPTTPFFKKPEKISIFPQIRIISVPNFRKVWMFFLAARLRQCTDLLHHL